MANILLVDDEINILRMTQIMLTHAGHEVHCCSSGAEALALIGNQNSLPYDVVLTDYRLNDITGLDVLRAVKNADPSTQVLLVTAYATTATAVEAMRDGAFDYIEKPFRREEILALIDKAYAKRTILHHSDAPFLHSDPAAVKNFIGDAPAMQSVMEMVMRVAPTKANILITGESGTGKEVIARAVHQLSGVKGPFIAVNCGAIPETLIESEFFGYVKGAFTGAIRDKIGYFQAAANGSIFLDEIGELPLPMQVKLLRAIQEKRVQRVGSTTEESISARIIAATNKDLRREVDEHRFREDLFFRLNVIQLSLPPLRERKEDLPKLIRHFLRQYNDDLQKNIQSVSPDALDLLMNYDYRGNVRELENILEHAATLEPSDEITIASLPAYLRNDYAPAAVPQPTAPHDGKPVTAGTPAKITLTENSSTVVRIPELDEKGVELEDIVEDIERSLIEKSLAKTKGNKTEAAKLLGISFRSMRYRLKKYGLE